MREKKKKLNASEWGQLYWKLSLWEKNRWFCGKTKFMSTKSKIYLPKSQFWRQLSLKTIIANQQPLRNVAFHFHWLTSLFYIAKHVYIWSKIITNTFLALLKRGSKSKLPIIKLSVDLQLQENVAHKYILMLLNSISNYLTMKMVKVKR